MSGQSRRTSTRVSVDPADVVVVGAGWVGCVVSAAAAGGDGDSAAGAAVPAGAGGAAAGAVDSALTGAGAGVGSGADGRTGWITVGSTTWGAGFTLAGSVGTVGAGDGSPPVIV